MHKIFFELFTEIWINRHWKEPWRRREMITRKKKQTVKGMRNYN